LEVSLYQILQVLSITLSRKRPFYRHFKSLHYLGVTDLEKIQSPAAAAELERLAGSSDPYVSQNAEKLRRGQRQR
jgi:hypothetical protein